MSKNKKRKKLSKKAQRKQKLFIFFAIVFALVLIILSLSFTLFLLQDKENNTIYTSKNDDKIYWSRLFMEDEASEIEELDMAASGIIIPSDLSLDEDINHFFSQIPEKSSIQNILLIIPDRKNVLSSPINTCDKCIFKTHDSIININYEAVDTLKKENFVSSNDLFFGGENAFLNIAPFVKHRFPNTDIIPILVDENLDIDELKSFNDFISNYISEEDLIILTMNFSENEILAMTEMNDFSSLNTINNFDFSNVLDLDTTSPKSLYLFMDLMEKQGSKNVEIINSLTKENSEKTDFFNSYHFIAFNQGKNLANKGISLLSFGNIDNDYDEMLLTAWNFDENYDLNADLSDTKFLKNLRTNYDRFLKGFDFLVFNLEENTCTNYSQNDFNISFCKYVEKFDPEDGEILDIDLSFMDDFTNNSDFTYMLYEFKEKEFDEDKRDYIIESFENKVDLFVGRGLKDFYSPDFEESSVFIYSLKDFMTNSKLATSLTADSEGLILGASVTEKSIDLYFTPIVIEKGYPSVKDPNLSDELFKKIISNADFSDIDFEIDAKKGYISVPR